MSKDKQIYILSKEDKPVKIVFESNPCPLFPQLSCEFVEFKEEDNDMFVLKCVAEKCDKTIGVYEFE